MRLATAANPARAQLNGGGVVDQDPDHLALTETSDVPTVPANAPVTLLVHASSDALTDSQPEVDVFDGPVSDGKLIAIRHLAGISPNGGGTVSFSWTPTTPGVHELHEVLLGRSVTGQDDEQIMRVNVAQPLEPYTVKAAASASSVPVGAAFSVTGTISPVPDIAYERTVQLQEKVGQDWKVIDTQQTSSNGRFDFGLTGTTKGSHTYRVWKIATSGRTAAVSAPVTVTVGGFAVTVKASPTSVDLGTSVTFTGTALPAQTAAADRTLDLQVKSGSTWKVVATGRTTTTGAYTLTTKPTEEGTFNYRVTKRPTDDLPAASSPTVSVKVTRQFTVTAKAKPTRLELGERATISGKVTPTVSRPIDRTVQLQLRSGSAWRNVTRATSTATGLYSFSVKPKKLGTYRYRVAKLGAAGKRTAYSPIVSVTVKR